MVRPVKAIPVEAPAGHTLIRVERQLHPWAWWIWAIGCALSVSLTSNPLAIAAVVTAVVFVVLNRRSRDAWAQSLGIYLAMAVFILVMRLFFQITIGGLDEGTVLFVLPSVELPKWAAGIHLGGPVTLEGLVYSTVTSARLAGLILCIGAANSLANPKSMLKTVPSAFHQIATALVITIAAIPQLVESVGRIKRAQSVRGKPGRGIRGMARIIVPVVEDSIDRSLALAASMESRGYGRTRKERRLGVGDAALLLGSMIITTFSVFALLGLPRAGIYPLLGLGIGVLTAVIAIHRSGRYLAVTRYRPQPWGGPEWLVMTSGLVSAAIMVWLKANDPLMDLSSFPLHMPSFSLWMAAAALAAALPGGFDARVEQESA